MTTITITIELMTDILTACHRACDLARKEDCNVRFDFNGKRMLASPGTVPELMAKGFLSSASYHHTPVENPSPPPFPTPEKASPLDGV